MKKTMKKMMIQYLESFSDRIDNDEVSVKEILAIMGLGALILLVLEFIAYWIGGKNVVALILLGVIFGVIAKTER